MQGEAASAFPHGGKCLKSDAQGPGGIPAATSVLYFPRGRWAVGFTITWKARGRLQTITATSAWEAVTELTRRGAWNAAGLKIKAPDDASLSLDKLAALAAEQGDDSQLRAKKSAAGRLGGLKGGKARTKAMTPEQRRAAALRAARARWQ